MEGNTSLSCQFVTIVQVYIYFSIPNKELFQIITHRCFTNLFLKKQPKNLNYIYIPVYVQSVTIRFPNLTCSCVEYSYNQKILHPKRNPNSFFFAQLLYPEYMKDCLFPSSLQQHILKLIISFLQSFIPQILKNASYFSL